jgi:hypothetical protein
MVIMHRIAARAWPLFCATALVSSATFAQESAEAAAQWNQQLLIAHKASDAHGVCEVYLRFKRWQQANWPEGAAAVARFFDTTVLPNFLQDRSKMEDKSAAQVETELLAFCTQAGEQSVAARNYFQAIADGQTEPPPAAEQREQAVGLRVAAVFRGPGGGEGEHHEVRARGDLRQRPAVPPGDPGHERYDRRTGAGCGVGKDEDLQGK